MYIPHLVHWVALKDEEQRNCHVRDDQKGDHAIQEFAPAVELGYAEEEEADGDLA